jgi:hypothetical protein
MSHRLQVELTDAEYELLKKLAGGRALSDLVRRALNMEAYLQDAESTGARLVIEREDGREREVITRL